MSAFLAGFLSNLATSGWAAGVSLVALAFVIWPLERLFPARPGQALLRPRWWTDLAFFAGQYLVWVGLAAVAIRALDARLIDPLIPRGLRAGFAAWPLPVQAVVVVMLGDISVYWFHRACHALPFLWRFHAVHHSAEHLDWLAAHREHPVDGLLTQLAVNAPALAFGFSLGQIAWLIALRGMWAIFVHSNVRLPLGPLRVLLGAPELHHWHHVRGAPVQNFANLAPWTDLLFGTYYNPRGPESWPLGTDHPLPRSYLGMLARPLWPRSSYPARMGRVGPAAILLLAVTGCASAPRAGDGARASQGGGPESEPALAIPTDLVRSVEQSARLGRLIYQVDKASAIGTDVLRARVPDYRSRRLAGWLTLEERDAAGDGPAFSVLFYNDENSPRFVFKIHVPRTGEPTLEEYAPPEALNDEMMRLFRARRGALAVAPTGRRQMNPVILPLSTTGQPNSILVYLLAAELEPGQMVFGVHYRVLASEDGFTIKDVTALSKSALVVAEKLPADVPPGAKLVAHMVSHLVTDWPLETHVFVSLLHKNVPIYVVTRRGTWLVIGDKITLVDDKPPVPR